MKHWVQDDKIISEELTCFDFWLNRIVHLVTIPLIVIIVMKLCEQFIFISGILTRITCTYFFYERWLLCLLRTRQMHLLTKRAVGCRYTWYWYVPSGEVANSNVKSREFILYTMTFVQPSHALRWMFSKYTSLEDLYLTDYFILLLIQYFLFLELDYSSFSISSLHIKQNVRNKYK